MNRLRHIAGLVGCLVVLGTSFAASAATIVDEWAAVKAPPAPELQAVTVDPKTTAVLMLDFVTQTCNEKVRPRCLASLPAARQLLSAARASNVLVVYSYVAGGKMSDTLSEVAPDGKEPAVQSGPNKFLGTDLEKVLKDSGIKTVIVAGTAAHGAVLHTGAEAIFRGFNVILPVDTMSAENAYVEQYVAYDFTAAPRLGAGTKLTRVDMIKF